MSGMNNRFQMLIVCSVCLMSSSDAHAQRISRIYSILPQFKASRAMAARAAHVSERVGAVRPPHPLRPIAPFPRVNPPPVETVSLPKVTSVRTPIFPPPLHNAQRASMGQDHSHYFRAPLLSVLLGYWVFTQVFDRDDARDAPRAVALEEDAAEFERATVTRLRELSRSSSISPEAYIAEVSSLYGELKPLFDADANVAEGFTIGEHTARTLSLYEDQKKYYPLAEISSRHPELGDLNELFKVSLLLHDIGKSLGPVDEQLHHTLPIAEKYLKKWGYTPEQVRIALLWIKGSQYGDFLKDDITVNELLSVVLSQAEESGMHLSDWVESSFLFYTADAASYPFVQKNSFKTGYQEKLIPDAPLLQELLARAELMSQKKSILHLVSSHELNRLVSEFVPVKTLEDNLKELEAVRSVATAEERREALEQICYDFLSFFPLIHFKSAEDQEDVTNFLVQVRDDFDHLIWMIKYKNHELRPFVSGSRIDEELDSLPLDAFDGSFPSGHAALAELHALILSELFPEQREVILKHAEKIGKGRVILGLHYPSDVEAGQSLAIAVYSSLHMHKDFQGLLEKFKAH